MFDVHIDESYLATSDLERVLAKHNIPRRLWHVTYKDIKFKQIKHKDIKITISQQKTIVRALAAEPQPGLVVIASNKTDEAGLRLASAIVINNLYNKGRKFLWVDAQNLSVFSTGAPFVVIYNVFDRATNERLQSIRDSVYRFPYSLCLLIVSNISDPIDFSINKLNMSAKYYLRVDVK